MEDDRWLRVPLYDEVFLLCCRRREMEEEGALDIKAIAPSRPFIGYAGGSSDEVEIERILRTLDVRPAKRMLVSSSHTLVGLLSETDGWSLFAAHQPLVRADVLEEPRGSGGSRRG